MDLEYKVNAFVPTVKGCGAKSGGWDKDRCKDFENYINKESQGGWKLHSYELRHVVTKGCGGGTGTWLVCIFERNKS